MVNRAKHSSSSLLLLPPLKKKKNEQRSSFPDSIIPIRRPNSRADRLHSVSVCNEANSPSLCASLAASSCSHTGETVTTRASPRRQRSLYYSSTAHQRHAAALRLTLRRNRTPAHPDPPIPTHTQVKIYTTFPGKEAEAPSSEGIHFMCEGESSTLPLPSAHPLHLTRCKPIVKSSHRNE